MKKQINLKDKYIGISGNIGAGKTTLCGNLSKLGFTIYGEPVKDNPFLDKFYKDPKQYAFIMQIFMLTKRYESTKQIIKNKTKGIQDRTIYEDKIFVSVLCDNGMMDEDQKKTYEDLVTLMFENIVMPDFLIYLDTEPQDCLERIKRRGRKCEESIELTYLQKLHDYYERFIKDISKKIPVFLLTKKNQNEDIQKIISNITEFYNSNNIKPGIIYL
jgi:deoxyadenosine/deoxycytidine kinase